VLSVLLKGVCLGLLGSFNSMRFFLGKQAIKAIHSAVDALFKRAKVRLLGRSYQPKQLVISSNSGPVGYRRDLSIPGIFEMSSQAEGMKPRDDLREQIVATAEAYMDATQAKAKAQVVNAVNAFITDAEHSGKTVDPKVVLGGELAEVMRKVTSDVKRIAATETTRTRNLGTVDAISKINTMIGVSDPTVAFIVIRDGLACEECVRIHLMPDKTTPRVWKLSEVSAGYHKRGEDRPCISELHPHGRCLTDRAAPVVTERGIVPVCEIVVGDMVLTHTGKFRKVLSTFGKKGLPVGDGEDLVRVEFKAPQGRVHKIRMTTDHLLLTNEGWIRADSLVPGRHTLSYLHKECENCKKPFPYNIKKPKIRFCSIGCFGEFKEGKPHRLTPTLEGKARRAEGVRKHHREELIGSGLLEEKVFVCQECKKEFCCSLAYVNKKGHRVHRAVPKFCGQGCRSVSTTRKQWANPEHRANISSKNKVSMLNQYQSGDRVVNIEEARKALYAAGGGPSKDQKALFNKVREVYPDAVMELKIGKYYADIAIPSVKTVIEWDGGGHWMYVYKGVISKEEMLDRDAKRQIFIEGEGWHVLRYSPSSPAVDLFGDIRRVALNSLSGYSFEPVEITGVVRIPYSKRSPFSRMFDIKVEGDESFVVLGIISHNCTMVTILPGYGFDSSGHVTYISHGYDVFKEQRGLASE
jgi:hypothetical protein